MDSLGDRMKEKYEFPYRIFLPGRMPIIIRVDGKAFHTFTRQYKRPFDGIFSKIMDTTAIELVKNIQGAEVAYIQSDEISILVHNYKHFTSEAWFDNNLIKTVSVSAAIATAAFNRARNTISFEVPSDYATFDSRAFVLPESEVCNYFIWRQNDAVRNSILSVAQSVFSHKEVMNKNVDELKEMLIKEGKDWETYPTQYKRGRCVTKEGMDYEIPLFNQDRNYIDKFLEVIDK